MYILSSSSISPNCLVELNVVFILMDWQERNCDKKGAISRRKSLWRLHACSVCYERLEPVLTGALLLTFFFSFLCAWQQKVWCRWKHIELYDLRKINSKLEILKTRRIIWFFRNTHIAFSWKSGKFKGRVFVKLYILWLLIFQSETIFNLDEKKMMPVRIV